MTPNQEIRAVLKAIRKISRALDIHSRFLNKQSGLTLPQLIVLRCVRDLGEPTGSAISKEVDLSPPTVLGILDKLTAKGLIERTRPDTNRRIVISRLTEKGTVELSKAPSPLGDVFERHFFALTEVQRAQMLKSLEMLGEFTIDDRLEQKAKILEPKIREPK
ncbi:MarR family winged helix-turn-helix transcriptional regulator [Cohaesibacter celericrescens]|uniref:MarR family transcriptional regulator n=1 Tax=Cohaesibacter celericrescens TaxID=2067669 RepID=A0A2N5XUR8_9HYPH|nr:MarR family winged helix-turn-helix transcriptional regulator [Cohaesibacter celericrescens]PLW78266.1 MarR family transcriptional regulator [Cohaesibacter celericrescens]